MPCVGKPNTLMKLADHIKVGIYKHNVSHMNTLDVLPSRQLQERGKEKSWDNNACALEERGKVTTFFFPYSKVFLNICISL